MFLCLGLALVIDGVDGPLARALKSGLGLEQMTPFIIGIISSGIIGYLSIAFLMRYLQTHNTYLFVIYRIALGIVVLLAFWLGFR